MTVQELTESSHENKQEVVSYEKHHTISLILLALLLAVGFTILTHNFPFPGKTSDDFSLITGSSQTYTPEEIQDAADAVLHYFKGFSGATMTKLQYVASSSEEDNWAEKDGMEQGIHFVSDFTTGDLPNKSSLNPNSTYQGWNWYVARSDDGHWKVVNHGQG